MSCVLWLLVTCLLPALAADQSSGVALETSETIFSVSAAVNICGYDRGLSTSDAVRAKAREQLRLTVEKSEAARSARDRVCEFYQDHRQADEAANLSQYLSLALNLSAPPQFTTTVPEAELPPDAGYVLGFVPLLQAFYDSAGVHRIWETLQPDYRALAGSLHHAVSQSLQETDIYLKLPGGNIGANRFSIFLEPMIAPGDINARYYSPDYYLVIAPAHGQLRPEAIRHMYLHCVLDRMAEGHPAAMQRLEPLLNEVRNAPLEQAFRTDISRLVTESLIRAIEARLAVAGNTKAAESERMQNARRAAQQGFVLAPYFAEQLSDFEKSATSLQLSYGGWLHDIDLAHEQKLAAATTYSTAPEELGSGFHMVRSRPALLLPEAEKRLAAGDAQSAKDLAQKALDQKREDPARALFILAQVSTANQDIEGATAYFQRTLAAAHEPRLVAWSHIYLGRICDLKEEREQAVEHYRAALAAGDATPATRAAAERGLQQPYEPRKN